jgi:hypothetical protein
LIHSTLLVFDIFCWCVAWWRVLQITTALECGKNVLTFWRFRSPFLLWLCTAGETWHYETLKTLLTRRFLEVFEISYCNVWMFITYLET